MMLKRAVLKDAAVGVGVTDTLQGFVVIEKLGCAAAIWRRALSPDIQTWIDGLHPDMLPNARVVLRPDMVRAAVREVCAISGTPEGAARESLIDDIAILTEHFASLMRAPFLRLKLERVTTNACRKFHIDTVTARLICTYRGTGTQYRNSTDGDPAHRIFTVPTGAPIVLRGTFWPDQPASGLLHRSPPIEATGETRLVLMLDPIFDPEDAI